MLRTHSTNSHNKQYYVILKSLFILCILASLYLPALSQAQLTSSVDQTEISQDDIFYFTLSSDQPLGQNARPDITPLEKDFDILGSSSSNQISIINGRSSRQTKWQFQLTAKRIGKVLIPAIKVGDEYSQPIALNVIQRGQTPRSTRHSTQSHLGNSGLIELEVTTNKQSVYIQEELQLTFRIKHSMPIYGIHFEYPGVSDAIEQQLGDGKQYSTLLDGQQVQVYEIRSVVYPLNSGTLLIPEISIIAEIADLSNTQAQRSRRQSPLDRFFGGSSHLNARKKIRRVHEPMPITVKPIPDAFPKDQPWLPATQVTINSAWHPANSANFSVGAPITRTLTLEVLGQHPNFIPELKAPNLNSFKIYPDTPTTDGQIRSSSLLGKKTLSYTFIPTEAGDQIIPEKNIYWWNTHLDTLQQSNIAENTFLITPNESLATANQKSATAQATSNASVNAQANTQNSLSDKSQNESDSQIPNDPLSAPNDNDSNQINANEGVNSPYFYLYLGLTLLIVIPLLFVICTLIYRKLNINGLDKEALSKPSTKGLNIKAITTKLNNACDSGDLQGISTHLLEWTNALIEQSGQAIQPCQSLEEIKSIFNDTTLSVSIDELQTALYAPIDSSNDKIDQYNALNVGTGTRIRAALKKIRSPEKLNPTRTKKSKLKPLYG